MKQAGIVETKASNFNLTNFLQPFRQSIKFHRTFSRLGKEVCHEALFQLNNFNFKLLLFTLFLTEEKFAKYQCFCFGTIAPSELQPSHKETSRSGSDTPQSVGLLWKSDPPEAEVSTWQHTTTKTDIQTFLRWDSNPQTQSERLQSENLDRVTTGIGTDEIILMQIF